MCFSSLLYKYRITVLFQGLNSSCVSHVKKEQYGSVFIAVLSIYSAIKQAFYCETARMSFSENLFVDKQKILHL